jgi:hypothetical protein
MRLISVHACRVQSSSSNPSLPVPCMYVYRPILPSPAPPPAPSPNSPFRWIRRLRRTLGHCRRSASRIRRAVGNCRAAVGVCRTLTSGRRRGLSGRKTPRWIGPTQRAHRGEGRAGSQHRISTRLGGAEGEGEEGERGERVWRRAQAWGTGERPPHR